MDTPPLGRGGGRGISSLSKYLECSGLVLESLVLVTGSCGLEMPPASWVGELEGSTWVGWVAASLLSGLSQEVTEVPVVLIAVMLGYTVHL